MLQPSVVEYVSETCSGVAPSSPATSSRSVAARRLHLLDVRLAAAARARGRAAAARRSTSAVGRASGPNVPAFRYATRSSTGNSARASSNVIRPPGRRARGRTGRRRRARAAPSGHAVGPETIVEVAHEHVVDARADPREPPPVARDVQQRPRPLEADVEVAGDGDRLAGLREPVDVDERAQELGVGEPLLRRIARRVQVRDERSCGCRPRARTAWHTRRSFAHASRASGPSASHSACARRKLRGLRVQTCRSRTASRGETRIALPWPEKAERRSPWWSDVTARPISAVDGSGPERRRLRERGRPRRTRSSRRAAAATTQAPPAGRRRPDRPGRRACTASAGNARRCGGLVLP